MPDRPYPKIWGTGNPGVARGAQRHLGRPFQTHAGGGASAYNEGRYSKIIIDPTGGDGWFSTSHPAVEPTRIRGTDSPRRKFLKRGSLPSAMGTGYFDTGILASGNGWGYVTQFVEQVGNVLEYSVRKTFDGGRSSSELFPFIFASPLENVGFAATFNAAYIGTAAFMSCHPRFFAEDINRQKPALRVFFKDEGAWVAGFIPMPPFTTDIDYTFGSFNMNYPQGITFATAEMGQLPTLWVTFDLGDNWGGFVMDDTTFYPGLDMPIPPWATEAAAPGATTEDKQANFVGQQEIQDIAAMAHPIIDFISLRRAIILTTFPTDYMGGDWVTVRTLFDVTDGTIIDQWTYPLDYPSEFIVQYVLGEDSWLHQSILWDGPPPPTVPDQDFDSTLATEVTWDAGATIVTPTTQAETRLFRPIVGAARPYEMVPIWPKVYYTVRIGGRRELWASDDAFGTTTKQTQIAPASGISYNHDYNSVTWVGQPGSAAPVDPCVPWRLDDRVAIPTWWMDGL